MTLDNTTANGYQDNWSHAANTAVQTETCLNFQRFRVLRG